MERKVYSLFLRFRLLYNLKQAVFSFFSASFLAFRLFFINYAGGKKQGMMRKYQWMMAAILFCGTRSVNGEQWPQLVIMLQEAGIDPSWVYVPSDILDLPHAKTMDEEAQQKLRDITKGIRELCEAPVDTLVKRVNEVSTSEWEPLSSEAQYQAYKKSYEEEYKKNMSKDDFIFFYKNHFLQYEISRLTGQKFVTDEMRQVGMEMCNTVISVFADRIKANTWLSEEGKKGVLEKLYAININVGCPKEWISEAIPDLSQSGSAVEDAYLMRKAALNFDKYVMGKSIKDVSFHMILSPDTENPLTEMNAFYAPNHNSINIYPWWLMKPCYDPSYNQAVNYAIMTVIAFIVMHDAMNVRYETGKQSQVLNELIEKFNMISDHDVTLEKKLEEFVGHTPIQVAAGFVLGVVVALIVNL